MWTRGRQTPPAQEGMRLVKLTIFPAHLLRAGVHHGMDYCSLVTASCPKHICLHIRCPSLPHTLRAARRGSPLRLSSHLQPCLVPGGWIMTFPTWGVVQEERADCSEETDSSMGRLDGYRCGGHLGFPMERRGEGVRNKRFGKQSLHSKHPTLQVPVPSLKAFQNPSQAVALLEGGLPAGRRSWHSLQ